MSSTYNEASNANGKRPNAAESDEAPKAPIELPLYKSKYVRVMIGTKKYKMLPEKWEALDNESRTYPSLGHQSTRLSITTARAVALTSDHVFA